MKPNNNKELAENESCMQPGTSRSRSSSNNPGDADKENESIYIRIDNSDDENETESTIAETESVTSSEGVVVAEFLFDRNTGTQLTEFKVQRVFTYSFFTVLRNGVWVHKSVTNIKFFFRHHTELQEEKEIQGWICILTT